MQLTSTQLRLTTLLGLAGLVISWALFLRWGLAYGFDPPAFFMEAVTTNAAGTGLTWDLIASGAILSVLAVARRDHLGLPRLLAVMAGTWILGVCVGFMLLLVFINSGASSTAASG